MTPDDQGSDADYALPPEGNLVADDELSLQEFEAFTQLDEIAGQATELEVEEEDNYYLPSHEASPKTRFAGPAGERQKRLLLQAWDDQLESKEDQGIKDFVHTVVFPAVVAKAKTYKTPRGHQIFTECQPPRSHPESSASPSPSGISLNGKVRVDFPLYSFDWFEDSKTLREATPGPQKSYENPRQYLEVVIAIGIKRASCPNDFVRELTAWASRVKRGEATDSDLDVRRFTGQGEEAGVRVSAQTSNLGVYTIRNEQVSVRDYVGYSLNPYRRLKSHKTAGTSQVSRLFPQAGPQADAFIVSNFVGHSPAAALMFETVLILICGLTDVHKKPTSIERARLKKMRLDKASLEQQGVAAGTNLTESSEQQLLQRLQFNTMMPGRGFFLSEENRKFSAEEYERAWAGICDIVAREPGRRLPRPPNQGVCLQSTTEWQQLLAPYIGDWPLFAIHHLVSSFWLPGSKGVETAFLKEVKGKTGVDLPEGRGVFRWNTGASYPRTAQWMSALASERPPDSQWAKKEVVLIKQDLDELHEQDAQRAKDDRPVNANVGGVKRDPLQAYHDPTAVAMRKDFPYELLQPTEPSKHGWQKSVLQPSPNPFEWRPELTEQDLFILDLRPTESLAAFTKLVNEQGAEKFGGLTGWHTRSANDVVNLLNRHAEVSYFGMPERLMISNKALAEENTHRLQHLQGLGSALFSLPDNATKPSVGQAIADAGPPILVMKGGGSRRLDWNAKFTPPVFELDRPADVEVIIRRTWLCKVIGMDGLSHIVLKAKGRYSHINQLLFHLVTEAVQERNIRWARQAVPEACRAHLKDSVESATAVKPLKLDDDCARRVLQDVCSRHSLTALELLRIVLLADPFQHPLWTELEVRLGADALAGCRSKNEIINTTQALQDYWTMNLQRLVLGKPVSGPHYLPVSFPQRAQWRYDQAEAHERANRGGNHADFDETTMFKALKKLAIVAPEEVFEGCSDAATFDSRLVGFALEITNGHCGPYWYKWLLYEIWGDWTPIFYGNRGGDHARAYFYKIRRHIFRWFLIYQRFSCNLDDDPIDRLLIKFHDRNQKWDYAPFLISRATGEPALKIASRMVDLKKAFESVRDSEGGEDQDDDEADE